MKKIAWAGLFLLAAFPGGNACAGEITDENFEKLHQLMQPQESELAWRKIPWHANLWDARREAAKTGKPIYLWEMDGHPLGCT